MKYLTQLLFLETINCLRAGSRDKYETRVLTTT